jgi:glutathione S-transferase
VHRSSDQTLSKLPVFSIESSLRQLEIDSQMTVATRELISMTTLPVLVVGERAGSSPLVVSGLAAVCRYVVKNSHDPALHHVLGFRSNCLQAPSEVSLWTAFCECQMTQSTLTFLSRPIDGNDVIELPVALVEFEEHLKQPVRMHNIVRHAQQLQQSAASIDSKEAANLVSHTYAEGPDMTLADLLLFPCVRLVTDRLTACGVALAEHLPRVALWLLTMATSVEPAWTKATTTTLESSLTRLTIIHHSPPAVKVPRVRSTSLYKKDSTRTRPSIVAVNANETTRLVDSLNRQGIWPSPECVGEGSTDLPTGLVLLFDSAKSTEADVGVGFIPRIDWSSLPEPAHPRYGQVPGNDLPFSCYFLLSFPTIVINDDVRQLCVCV